MCGLAPSCVGVARAEWGGARGMGGTQAIGTLPRSQVLTIAHRLHTVMHCDTVVMMSAGKVVERGPPQELKDTAGSQFAQLWKQSQ